MSQNVSEFEWTKTREKAALLVANGQLTEDEIAAKLSINRRTLVRWKTEEAFKARVAEHVAAIREALKDNGIAEKLNRVAAYNDRWKRMQEVIEQRAKAHADVEAGGNTGLVVRQIKGIGKGENFREVEEYAVDTGLLRELREHEKQAAQELGQLTEKAELNVSVDVTKLTDEQLSAIVGTQSKG